jgi:RimJ/RimL family protein N-acetyltransferase
VKIIAKRLELQPFSSPQLNLFVNNPKQLTRELALMQELEPLSSHMKKVYHLKETRIEEEPFSLIYNTYFAIILKEPRIMIGSLGLNGKPDDEGIIEVGYWIEEPYQNRGFMKEALEAFLHWILQFNEVSGVNACTSDINISSQKVLTACGFDRIYKDKDLLIWRYTSL